METLEGRRLLVVGIVPAEAPPQNFANPEDANYDGSVSPADALIVINELNNPNTSGSPTSISKDIDGDGVVTPRDALLVINRLNSRSDKSSVPPQERAIGLRKALDAGYLPPNMSPSDAQELLETLENGGHYEAGERYRDGQMINIKLQPESAESSDPFVEAEGSDPSQQSVGSTTENLVPESGSPQLVEEEDPFALFDSADETLSEPIYDSTLWNSLLDSTDIDPSEYVDRLAAEIAESLVSEDGRERLAQAVSDALESGDTTVEDIANELAAMRAMLGDTHSQVSQLFANLDIEAIIEQLGIDLGTLAEAVLSHDLSDPSEREAIFADFLGREYLTALSVILP